MIMKNKNPKTYCEKTISENCFKKFNPESVLETQI